jgi:hypothetical protein
MILHASLFPASSICLFLHDKTPSSHYCSQHTGTPFGRDCCSMGTAYVLQASDGAPVTKPHDVAYLHQCPACRHAANPLLHQQACQLLSCESQQLQDVLLNKLQEAASTALAAKAAVGSSRLQKQLQQQYKGFSSLSGNKASAAADAAAAVAAAAGDGTGGASTDVEEDNGSTQQQQQQQQRQSQLRLRDSAAVTEKEGQDLQINKQVMQIPTMSAPSQQWQQHGQVPQHSEQRQHESSLVLPPPAAALWSGAGGGRKRGRRVAVLEELHEEQQGSVDCELEEVLCFADKHVHADKEQQQQQQQAVSWLGQSQGGGSSLNAQAAPAEQPEQQGTRYRFKMESSAESAAVAVAGSSGAASRLFGSSLMTGVGAAVPLQLGEAAECADTLPTQLEGPASAAGTQPAQAGASSSQQPAAAVGGWRQRKQLPVGRRRVSGSAVASLF